VGAVQQLAPEDTCDLVIVAVPKNHVSEVLPALAANRHTPNVLFMGNNAAGPGGSGKPLIGLALVASWLRQGGKVVLVPLQYPDRTFTKNGLARLYHLQLSDYAGAFFFIKLDLDLEAGVVEQSGPDEARANLVNPKTWTRALDLADQALGQSDLGTLVYGSALNLLLFSPTYGERMLSRLETVLREDKSRTYLFTVSSSALKEKIVKLEQAADHLMFTQMTQPEKKLHLRVARLRGAPYMNESIVVPFSRETLNAIRQMTNESRVAQIPTIRKI
jgi:archaellum biogenesis ATPase FlaH